MLAPGSPGTLRCVRARAALFDVYGDHLRSRGGVAPVAALVRLLAPLGIAAPAVRTAISRMVRQGWLTPAELPSGPGYGLTGRAVQRLDDAAVRIYRTRDAAAWPGRWHLLVISPPASRSARNRLAAELAFLGYGQLAAGAWIAPWRSGEAATRVTAHGGQVEEFTAEQLGDPEVMVRQAWDLDRLAAAYDRFVEDFAPLVATVGALATDEQAFAARSRLVHTWRKFLFADPGLPPDLLPERWAGRRAAAFFDAEASRLLPAATRFVTACLAPTEAVSLPTEVASPARRH